MALATGAGRQIAFALLAAPLLLLSGCGSDPYTETYASAYDYRYPADYYWYRPYPPPGYYGQPGSYYSGRYPDRYYYGRYRDDPPYWRMR